MMARKKVVASDSDDEDKAVDDAGTKLPDDRDDATAARETALGSRLAAAGAPAAALRQFTARSPAVALTPEKMVSILLIFDDSQIRVMFGDRHVS